jgi:2-polyprenyl-3-methyl-5-hydroxy-6-metoxy-1,4-benzoquinol methylase
MAEAIAGELASYTGQPVDQVLALMERGTHDFEQLWRAAGIDPTNRGAVEEFYRRQFVEAYELANWHCGRTNGEPPLNYAHVAHVAKAKGFRRALDYGSGIGTGALCLHEAGCAVDCADIAQDLLKFVGYRLARRQVGVTLVDLASGQTPAAGQYDVF